MKKLLIVVDFQADFVNGSLGFDSAKELEEGICKKIENARSDGDDIIFTFDTHDENYLHTQEGVNLPILHCQKDTPGWQLYGKARDLIKQKDKCFYKSGFGSLELATYLQECSYTQIEIVGLVTNLCIITQAVLAKSALLETEIIVDSTCVDSYDKDLHQKSLDVMNGMQITVL